MPYTLKTNQISVKDPVTGEYQGVDILTEQTEQGLIAELQAEGTTQVNRITQAAADVQAAVDQAEIDAAEIISDTQTAVNALEAQKNTIAQTVASMAELGTDTTLTTTGMAADAKTTGDQLSDLNRHLANGVESITNGKVPLITDEYPGYYSGTGSIIAQSSTSKEYYTNKIAVTPGEQITITLDIASSNTMWVTVAEFASDQTFKARLAVDTTTVGTTVTRQYTVRSDVYYISITYRTYGEHSIIATKPWDFYVSTNNSIYRLDNTVNIYGRELLQAAVYTYLRTVVSGQTVSASSACFEISIPANTRCSFTLYDDNGIVPNGAYRFYINNIFAGYTIPVNTEKILFATESINSLSVHFVAANAGTFYCVLKIFDSNEISNFEKTIGVAKRLHHNILLPSDLEEGAIQDGTGEDTPASSQRVRTKVYLPVNKGQHIKCSLDINVYEYQLSDKSYIRDNSAWTHDYTVQNDCYVRILFYNGNNAYTNSELIDKLQIESFTFNGCLTDTKLVEDIAENVIETTGFDTVFEQLNPYILPSTTVKTIAHRGDDIVAPQCTAPAYIAARKRGIEIMENDLWLSEDGEFVMWHDTTLNCLGNLVDINGYAMYTDGTDYYWVDGETVYTYDYEDGEYDESAVSLESLTRCVGSDYGVNSTYDVIGLNLNVLKRLDFGVYKGEQFAGTQILTFEEWVLLCKQLGAGCYIDKKLSYTNELITQAASIVKKYGMGGHTSWLGLSVSQIEHLRTIIPGARCGVLSHPNSTNIVSYASVNNGNFFFNGNAKDGMTEEAIQLGLNAGYDVEVWYVDYSTETEEQVLTVLRNAINCGVTGVTADHYRASDAYRYMLD